MLRFYAWLFALGGALFVFAAGPMLAALNALGAALPGAKPLAGSEHSLWLGLSGSMMAMISYLAFSLSRNPDQETVWNTLLLSKGASTALFALFAAADRNALFLPACAVDGSIFLHLLLLKPAKTGYEVWFAKMNDPATRSALWIRHTRQGEASDCWYVLFDKPKGRVLSGKWPHPFAPMEQSLRAEGPRASWDLTWRSAQTPPFSFVPEALASLVSSDYRAPASLAHFSGTATIDGRTFEFKDAPGSIGRIRGRRMADNWRWVQAAFSGGSVFELLSAQVRRGPFSSPRLTTAHLWHRGRHYASADLGRALTNQADGRTFRVDFGELIAEGECRPDEGLTAELSYGSRRCRSSMTGALHLTLKNRGGTVIDRLKAHDSAAIESVENAPGLLAAAVAGFAQTYAAHAGLAASRERIEQKLILAAWWARLAMAGGALFLRWLAPALVLGKARPFDGLAEAEREEFLRRLQTSRLLPLRGAFLMVKSLVLSSCYGRDEYLSSIGCPTNV